MNTLTPSRTNGPTQNQIDNQQAFNRLRFGRSNYVRNGKQLLTRAEEIKLCAIYQGKSKGNPDAALAELVDRNHGLIDKIASQHAVEGSFPFEDAWSAAALGFITACGKFDEARGCKLSTMAIPWMTQSTQRRRHQESNLIHIPFHVVDEHRIFKNKFNCLSQELGRDPTAAEVEEHLHVSKDKLQKWTELPTNFLSLDMKMGVDEDTYLVDLLAEPVPSLDAELFCANFDLQVVSKGILNLLDNEKSKDVLRRRFGMEPYDHPQTLAEIGADLNLSREGVRQIMVRAIKKIRLSLGMSATLEDCFDLDTAKPKEKRPRNLGSLIERNDSILHDFNHGLTYWQLSEKYRLGTSRIKQCCQEARKRQST